MTYDQYVRLHQDISYGGNLILIDWSTDFFSSYKIYLAPIIIRLCQFEAPLLVSLVYLVLNKKRNLFGTNYQAKSDKMR